MADTLQVVEALENGATETLSARGLKLAAIYYGMVAVLQFAGLSFAASVIDAASLPAQMGAVPAFGISPVVSGALLLVGIVAAVAVWLGVVRSIYNREVDASYFTENLLRPGAHMLLGGLVFGVLVGAGFMLLVVPGLYIMAALYFWLVYVAVDDTSFMEAFRSTWAATTGNRLRTFGLFVAVAIVSTVVSSLVSLPVEAVAPGPVIEILVTGAATAVTSVFNVAVMVEAYRQLS